jgi:two-component system sensor histidine kinase KdpD
MVLAVASFLSFNFFLIPPFYTFAIEDPLDWWILIAFLVTGGVAAQLFHRTQRALELAERRAGEIDRLSSLGAESLSVPRAADAVTRVAEVIRSELPVARVRIVMVQEASHEPRVLAISPNDGGEPLHPDLIRLAVREGCIVAVGADGASHVESRGRDFSHLLAGGRRHVSAVVPLRVREQTIGALEVGDPRGLTLDASQAAFADTLTYYAALAVERARLAAEADHVSALREADRLKDALVASVSHDLRTPLTTIRALAAELRGSGDERVLVIEEEAERLNRLVSDLLDLSRIRAGGLPLEPEIVAAEDLVGAALQRLRGIPGAEGIQVRLPPGDILAVGRFDFVQTLRALGNLLENALRHAGALPVEMEVEEEEGSLVFRVLDRGPGIPEAERERIFEPFFHGRPDAGAGADVGGTGLGLAIARSVAEAQGGSVHHRPRPGGGSVFELRLPAESLKAMSRDGATPLSGDGPSL